MTSRQAGKRLAAMSAAGRRRPAARRRPGSAARRKEPCSPPGDLIRLVISGGIFVLLVAGKLLLPDQMARINQTLSGAMERNMDVQAVFSAVGRAFTGESGLRGAAGEVYRAVFHPEEDQEALETAGPALLLQEDGSGALDRLRRYLPDPDPGASQAPRASGGTETAGKTQADQAASMAYVLYSDQNLPENVSMQQAILDFDYCVPVNGTVSSPFGYREHPTEGEERFHYGLDLAADEGTEIRCFADGTVTAVGDSSSYGKYCMVTHSGGFTTLYAHCSRITASSGAQVSQGQKIAEVGQTGVATGPHLHFEIQQSGTYLNPVYYVS